MFILESRIKCFIVKCPLIHYIPIKGVCFLWSKLLHCSPTTLCELCLSWLGIMLLQLTVQALPHNPKWKWAWLWGRLRVERLKPWTTCICFLGGLHLVFNWVLCFKLCEVCLISPRFWGNYSSAVFMRIVC